MPSFNKVTLIGRLTKDPELRYTQAGIAQTNITLAVDRPFKDKNTGERKADFFRCKAWKQKAEFVSNYLGKGRLVCVEGRIELNEGTNQQGEKTYYTDIVIDNIESLDSPKDGAAPRESGSDENLAPEPEPVSQRAAAPRPVAATVAPRRAAARSRPAAVPVEDDFDESDSFADA